MSAPLCTCGQPVASCPHLGIFASIDEKHAYFKTLAEVRIDLDSFAARTDAALALAVAQRAAGEAAKLPLPGEVAEALGVVISALAKAGALMGL